MPDDERKKVEGILNRHDSLDFVQRIFSPEKYPKIKLETGEEATHQMSWAEVDGKFIVYPNIVHKDGVLEWLDGGEAVTYAIDSGEYIAVDSEEEADWLSKKYKLIWPEGRR